MLVQPWIAEGEWVLLSVRDEEEEIFLMETAYTKEERQGTVSNVSHSDGSSISGVQLDGKR